MVERIGSWSSVAGILVTMTAILIAVFNSDWSMDSVVAVVTLGAIALILGILALVEMTRYHSLDLKHAGTSYEIKQLEERIDHLTEAISDRDQKIQEICKISHNLNHGFRNQISRLLSHVEMKVDGTLTEGQISEDYASLNKFLLYALSNLKAAFDAMTKDTCAVCIKIIVPSNTSNDIWVKTLVRDPISHRERSQSDIKYIEYPYYENTAFKDILSDDIDSSYFICNDLAGQPGYFNKNRNWKNLYNATAVAPIRIALSGNTFSYIGFLCVDNKKGGFQEDTSLQLLMANGDMLFALLHLFEEIRTAPKGDSQSQSSEQDAIC